MKTGAIVPVDAAVCLVSQKKRIPFNAFARDLLNFHTEQERVHYLQSVCKDTPELQHAQFSNDTIFARHVLRQVSRQEIRMLPSNRQQQFTHMMLSYITEVNLFRRCYYACLAAMDDVGLHRALIKAKLLHLLTEAVTSIPDLIRDRTSYIQDEDLQNRYIQHCLEFAYKELQNLPYIDFYLGFREEEAELQKRFGRSLSPRLNNKSQVTFWYYDNPDAAQETDSRLKVYAAQYGDDSITKDMSSLSPASVIDAKILQGLDRFTSDYIALVDTRWDSAERCSYWETNRADMALYLCMMTEILSRQDIRFCKICGKLFIPSRSTKVYCDGHTKAQINYFNRLIKGKYEKPVAT